MKKIFLVVSLVLVMCITGCSTNADTAALESQIVELKSENEKLKTEIASMGLDDLVPENTEVETNTNEGDVAISDNFINITVKITDKINFEKDINARRFNPFVELVYSITNNTDKEIKGIQGILHIKDMFGKKIIDMQFDLTTQNVPIGETISVSGYGMDVNEFMNEHMKLYNTSYDNILFEYEFEQVIFADGSAINK